VPGCQKLQMTGLTRSDTGCFIAVPIWQQWASKGLLYVPACMYLPAVVADDLSKLGLVLAVIRVAQHVFIVSVVRYVPVLRNKVHVEYPDVDSQSGLTVPVEVRRLSRVRHVVGRLQVAGTVQVFEEDIARRFHLHL